MLRKNKGDGFRVGKHIIYVRLPIISSLGHAISFSFNLGNPKDGPATHVHIIILYRELNKIVNGSVFFQP